MAVIRVIFLLNASNAGETESQTESIVGNTSKVGIEEGNWTSSGRKDDTGTSNHPPRNNAVSRYLLTIYFVSAYLNSGKGQKRNVLDGKRRDNLLTPYHVGFLTVKEFL